MTDNCHSCSVRFVRGAVAFLCALGLVSSASAASKTKPGKAADRVDQFLAETNIVKIQIEIPEPAVESLKKYQWNFGPQQEREKVKVTVREGATVYTNVSLQLKGAAGSFRAIDDRPAMTLNFDKFAEGQNFHGLEKLSLNNSVQDPTYVSEQFARELFLKAGVPVPRASHARVSINGRDVGLYVLVEGWDREFLKRHFKKGRGHLYDGGFIKDISDELPVNVGEAPKDQADRKALLEAVKEPDLARRVEQLEKVLDVDRFITLTALDVMLWDWDGYAMNKNNWRLYHNAETGRMVFMPHGLDQLFWKPDGPVLPEFQGVTAKAVLEVPQYRRRYLDRIRELRRSVFDVDAMTNRIAQIAAKVRPVVADVDKDGLSEHDTAVQAFSRAVVQRAASIDRQLARPIEPPAFDAAGAFVLADGWQPRIDFGRPQLATDADAGKKGALRVAVNDGSSIGAWTTSLWLEKGTYQIESRVKLRGLVPDPGDPRPGVAVRIKGKRPDKYTTGDLNWEPVRFEFRVEDALTEIQLLCEFRGAAGEALFDLESLKLIRLPSTPAK